MNFNKHCTLSEFSAFVARARREGPFAPILTVGEEFARHALSTNIDNRDKDAAKINEIVINIDTDAFKFNGESVIFDEDGCLIDGQNRMAAVLLAKKPITTVVVFGVPREARDTIDGGKSRTLTQVFKLNGISNAAFAHRIVSQHALFELGLRTRRRHDGTVVYLTTADVVNCYRKKSAEYDAAVELSKSKIMRPVRNQTAVGAAYMVLHEVNPKKADEFFMLLGSGANLPSNSPILYTRDRLQKRDADSLAYMDQDDGLDLILRTWNHWRKGTFEKEIQLNRKTWPKVVA